MVRLAIRKVQFAPIRRITDNNGGECGNTNVGNGRTPNGNPPGGSKDTINPSPCPALNLAFIIGESGLRNYISFAKILRLFLRFTFGATGCYQ